MSVKYYNLNDYNTILFDDFHFKLEDNVYEIIKQLSSKFGSIVEKETEKKDFSKSRRKSNFSNENSKSEDAWTHLRTFKSTVIVEKKEGSEQTMSDIRVCLNKISLKNFETNKTKIIEMIHTLTTTEDIKKVANTVFEIASTNKFFSELYAELYKFLIEHFEIFKDLLNDLLSNFTDTMRDIKYVDPNGNYDAFCAYNKQNDSRKAITVFIVNLVKKGILDASILSTLSLKTLSILFEYIDQEDKVNEAEEITENIFLLVTQSHENMKEVTGWNDILDKIKTLSKLKMKEKPSLSSRAIFKYMDIVDKLHI
jgi:hypothetical protein